MWEIMSFCHVVLSLITNFFSYKLFTLKSKKQKTKQKIRILYFLKFIVLGHFLSATLKIRIH